MFLFVTLSTWNAFIYHLATRRAKAYRSVWAPVIEIAAPFSLNYHHFLLSIYDCEPLRSAVTLSRNSLPPNLRIRIVHVRLSVLRESIGHGQGCVLTNQRTLRPLLQCLSISS
jgi:hypothetical protein